MDSGAKWPWTQCGSWHQTGPWYLALFQAVSQTTDTHLDFGANTDEKHQCDILWLCRLWSSTQPPRKHMDLNMVPSHRLDHRHQYIPWLKHSPWLKQLGVSRGHVGVWHQVVSSQNRRSLNGLVNLSQITMYWKNSKDNLKLLSSRAHRVNSANSFENLSSGNECLKSVLKNCDAEE